MAVKVGMIGMGGMGCLHFQGLASIPQAQVVAVCDVRPERLEDEALNVTINIDAGLGRAANLGGLEKYTDYKKMLRKADIDMVHICTPTDLHAQMAIAALKAGKHVFCEKPIALSSRMAGRMVQAAAAAGKYLMIGHVLRFWPEYVMIKEMIDSGKYGHVRSAVFRRVGGMPGWSSQAWYADSKRSGHATLDLHIHDVDLINWIFGKPAKVSSQGVVEPDGGVRYIVTQYGYDHVPLVAAEAGWVDALYPFYMALTVDFEKATVGYDSSRKPTLTIYDSQAGKKETPEVSRANGYTEEVRYLIECIEAGRPPGRATGADAAAAVAIAEAEIRSVKARKPVRIK